MSSDQAASRTALLFPWPADDIPREVVDALPAGRRFTPLRVSFSLLIGPAMEATGESPEELLRRHVGERWEDTPAQLQRRNETALRTGEGYVVSLHRHGSFTFALETDLASQTTRIGFESDWRELRGLPGPLDTTPQRQR